MQVGYGSQKRKVFNDGCKTLVKRAPYNLLNLSNSFSSLNVEEDSIPECLSKNKDAKTLCEIFTIGRKNIFRQGKVKRSKEVCETREFFHKDFMKCDIDLTIFEVEIKSKRALKKCRTCSFKKRQCVFDPTKCKALNLHCFACKKPGHFPKSPCCKKKRIVHHKSKDKVKTQVGSSNQHHITKKNMKLIKKTIKKLEMEHRRNTILKLAEKCAEKFKDGKYENGCNKFSKYCIRKLQNLLKTTHIPNKEEMKKIKDILKVYDQMFYSRDENENILHPNEISSEDRPTPNELISRQYDNRSKIPVSDQIHGRDDECIKEKIEDYEEEIFYSDCGDSVCDVDDIVQLNEITDEELSNPCEKIMGYQGVSIIQIAEPRNKIKNDNENRTDWEDEQYLSNCMESDE